jgi:hypothetical protein
LAATSGNMLSRSRNAGIGPKKELDSDQRPICLTKQKEEFLRNSSARTTIPHRTGRGDWIVRYLPDFGCGLLGVVGFWVGFCVDCRVGFLVGFFAIAITSSRRCPALGPVRISISIVS